MSKAAAKKADRKIAEAARRLAYRWAKGEPILERDVIAFFAVIHKEDKHRDEKIASYLRPAGGVRSSG